jgi:4-aminobutyrate aminotransferase / (S)-3-amino-2-methylpropionate transaminase / 5-aminovalerate transaminase
MPSCATAPACCAARPRLDGGCIRSGAGFSRRHHRTRIETVFPVRGPYGGNALACAAALAVLDAFEQDGLLERARELGQRLNAGLTQLQKKHAGISEVRGLGFMQAIELVTDRDSKQPDAGRAQRLIDRAREGGLLVIKCGVHRNVVRFLAPLVLSEQDLDRALAILDTALNSEQVSIAA